MPFDVNVLIQGLMAVILIGVFYNLWVTTRAYGGIIGKAVRYLGVGLILITIAVFEKALVNFGAIHLTTDLALIQDTFNLLGLFFLGIGFSKLAAAAKS